MYGLIGSITAQPGQREALAAILLRAANAMQALEGCYLYIIANDPTDADKLWITEVWRSAEDHQASLQDAGVIAAISEGRPLIAGMGDRKETVPLGGKGITSP